MRELRESSREVVRRLGLLAAQPWLGISTSQNHALIEIEREGPLTAADLATRLHLDRSTLSRLVQGLVKAGYVREDRSPSDRRIKPLVLTEQGRELMRRTHQILDEQVGAALDTLDEADLEAVLRGMATYAKALRRKSEQERCQIRPIRPEDDPAVARLIRTVMPEFGAAGPGFAIHDPEVDAMTAAYPPPRAGYFVVEREGKVLGGAGFAQLVGGADDVCELRKMYFLPELRGIGMGRRLMAVVLDAAAEAGFRRCYLETLASMRQARSLYESFGFRPLSAPMGATGHFSCDAWYARDLDKE